MKRTLCTCTLLLLTHCHFCFLFFFCLISAHQLKSQFLAFLLLSKFQVETFFRLCVCVCVFFFFGSLATHLSMLLNVSFFSTFIVIVLFNIITYNLFLCESFNTLVWFRYVLFYILCFSLSFLFAFFFCVSFYCFDLHMFSIIFVTWFFWSISLVINLLSMCNNYIYDCYSES
jgi:hypothetical protein